MGSSIFGLSSSIKAQAKSISKTIDGQQFVPLVSNSQNLIEPFFKAFDEKVDKYTDIFTHIDGQIQDIDSDCNELAKDNHDLMRVLQDQTEDIVKFRSEGANIASDSTTKKEILLQLEHKLKAMKKISDIYRHAREKMQAAVETKKKLLEEYRIELVKLEEKVKLAGKEFDKKRHQAENSKKTLSELELKFKKENGGFIFIVR